MSLNPFSWFSSPQGAPGAAGAGVGVPAIVRNPTDSTLGSASATGAAVQPMPPPPPVVFPPAPVPPAVNPPAIAMVMRTTVPFMALLNLLFMQLRMWGIEVVPDPLDDGSPQMGVPVGFGELAGDAWSLPRVVAYVAACIARAFTVRQYTMGLDGFDPDTAADRAGLQAVRTILRRVNPHHGPVLRWCGLAYHSVRTMRTSPGRRSDTDQDMSYTVDNLRIFAHWAVKFYLSVKALFLAANYSETDSRRMGCVALVYMFGVMKGANLSEDWNITTTPWGHGPTGRLPGPH